jgi:hypothetical protein
MSPDTLQEKPQEYPLHWHADALLLAGSALSIPGMIVINSTLGPKRQ